MAASISVSELMDSKDGKRFHLVDVRSPSEFATGHIPGAVSIPMDQIESRVPDLDRDGPIVLVCQSGKRARMVAGLLEPCGKDLLVLEGGTSAWVKAGHPTVASARTRWSLERQVRLGAGLLVLTGVITGADNEFSLDLSCRLCGAGIDVCRSDRYLPHGATAGIAAMEPLQPLLARTTGGRPAKSASPDRSLPRPVNR